MMTIEGEPGGRFLGAAGRADGAAAVILGAPFDSTTSFFPGTRLGPRRIREASEGIETYSPALDRDLEEVRFFDAGDLELPFGNPAGALERIEKAVRKSISQGSLPLLLGGEHLVTLGAVRAHAALHKDLAVVQFDAHTDLREEYLGETHSHATVMRRIAEIIGPENVYQFGLRSGTKEEFQFGHRSTHFHPGDFDRASLRHALDELSGRPVYVTIDIDVVDPAYAPGTGTPEAGGWRPQELLAGVYELGQAKVVGCDLVEVCPPAEHGAVTSLLGAKLVRELLLCFAL